MRPCAKKKSLKRGNGGWAKSGEEEKVTQMMKEAAAGGMVMKAEKRGLALQRGACELIGKGPKDQKRACDRTARRLGGRPRDKKKKL